MIVELQPLQVPSPPLAQKMRLHQLRLVLDHSPKARGMAINLKLRRLSSQATKLTFPGGLSNARTPRLSIPTSTSIRVRNTRFIVVMA